MFSPVLFLYLYHIFVLIFIFYKDHLTIFVLFLTIGVFFNTLNLFFLFVYLYDDEKFINTNYKYAFGVIVSFQRHQDLNGLKWNENKNVIMREHNTTNETTGGYS